MSRVGFFWSPISLAYRKLSSSDIFTTSSLFDCVLISLLTRTTYEEEGEGEMNGESSIGAYTLPYVK